MPPPGEFEKLGDMKSPVLNVEGVGRSNLNRVAIVTGASRGLGLVIASTLAARGYDLVIGARDTDAIEQAAAFLRSETRRVMAVAGDVAAAAVRKRLVDAACSLGTLQVVINNASELGGLSPVVDQRLDTLERILQVNLVAPIGLLQLSLPLLTETGGLVVNISSDAAQGAYPGWGGYGSSKAALDLVTRTVAAELAGRDAVSRGDRFSASTVAIVSVDPGDMRTRMHQEAFPGEDISDRPLPEATRPFWNWLFDQEPAAINGRRFAAQQEEAVWLVRA
jgi:NAD(P)-dependent dehydrogenase (short-subunit alcohol dehydrogenase family)